MNGPDDGNNVLVKFDHVVHQTDDAILIVQDDEEVWIPFSQITAPGEEDELREMWIPLWLAEKKGLSYD